MAVEDAAVITPAAINKHSINPAVEDIIVNTPLR
jgi:hypothetical protein